MRQIPSLESRIETPSDGNLIINPIQPDDSGFYECRVSNGIGDVQTASKLHFLLYFMKKLEKFHFKMIFNYILAAYLNVECKF